MKECVDSFINAGLWAVGSGDQASEGENEIRRGYRFIGHSMAGNVLKDLGIEDAAGLYDQLVVGLLNTLSDPLALTKKMTLLSSETTEA